MEETENEEIIQDAEAELVIEAEKDNLFTTLAAIDVTPYTSTVVSPKKSFTYLPWAIAWAILKQHCPDATYEVIRHPEPYGSPDTVGVKNVLYLSSKVGYWVEVALTVNGKTQNGVLHVLDNRNYPIPNPSTSDINKTIMRCLVKTIAMHTGLGISLFTKETFLEDDSKTPRNTAKKGEDAPVDPAKKAIVDKITARGNAIAISYGDISKLLKKRYKTTQIFDLSIADLNKVHEWMLKTDSAAFFTYLKS